MSLISNTRYIPDPARDINRPYCAYATNGTINSKSADITEPQRTVTNARTRGFEVDSRGTLDTLYQVAQEPPCPDCVQATSVIEDTCGYDDFSIQSFVIP